MGMIISDAGTKKVAALGEKSIHMFDSTSWKAILKEYEQ
jgi:hypothetical protein